MNDFSKHLINIDYSKVLFESRIYSRHYRVMRHKSGQSKVFTIIGVRRLYLNVACVMCVVALYIILLWNSTSANNTRHLIRDYGWSSYRGLWTSPRIICGLLTLGPDMNAKGRVYEWLLLILLQCRRLPQLQSVKHTQYRNTTELKLFLL